MPSVRCRFAEATESFGDNSPYWQKKAKTISSQLEIEHGINWWIEGRLTTAPTGISIHRLTSGGEIAWKECFLNAI
jgi:hypothetical protein